MITVRFDIIWRAAGSDTVLATATHTFNPNPPGPTQYDAVPFETDVDGIAAPAKAGDLLLLRFTPTGGATGASYIPNGDGKLANGRDPNLTLP